MGSEQGDKPLSVDEFTRWTGNVDKTLGVIVQGQQDHGERLARIESRQEERDRLELLAALKPLKAQAKENRRRLGLSPATWTTGISTGVAAVGGILYRLGWYPAWMERLVKP